jgi:hypothetical protein
VEVGIARSVLERAVRRALYEQPAACQQQLGTASGQVATMESNLITAYKTVLAKAPNAQVRVLNYPTTHRYSRTGAATHRGADSPGSTRSVS